MPMTKAARRPTASHPVRCRCGMSPKSLTIGISSGAGVIAGAAIIVCSPAINSSIDENRSIGDFDRHL